MVFKLADAAQKSWHRLRGHNQLPKVIQGAKFADVATIASSEDAKVQGDLMAAATELERSVERAPAALDPQARRTRSLKRV
jgi:hypothetical protein